MRPLSSPSSTVRSLAPGFALMVAAFLPLVLAASILAAPTLPGGAPEGERGATAVADRSGALPQAGDRLAELVARGVERRMEARSTWGNDRPEKALGLAQEARELLDQALALASSRADSVRVLPDLAEARNLEGLTLWTLTRYAEAVERYEAARAIWVALDDRGGLGRVHNNLGAAYFHWGYYDLALESFLESLHFREAQADTAGMARALVNVGLVRMDWHQLDEAEEVLTRATALADASGGADLRSYAHLSLAGLHLQRGDLDAAEAAFRLAGSLVPSPPYAQVPLGLAEVLSARGDHREAIRLFTLAAEEAQAAGQRRLEVRALLHLGETYLASGEPLRATAPLEEALALAESNDIRPLQFLVLETLARVHEARGNPVAALAVLRRHQQLRDAIYSQGTGQRFAATEARLEADRQARENLQLRLLRSEQEERLARQRQLGFLGGVLVLALGSLLLILSRFNRQGREREEALAEANRNLEATNLELTRALQENRTLQGLIPICSHCKKVRDDRGYWEAVETYIGQRSEAFFSHSICAECGPRMYGDDWVEERDEERSPEGSPGVLAGDIVEPSGAS